MNRYMMLENKICKELDLLEEKYRTGAEMSEGDLRKLDLLSHSIKSLITYVAMKQNDMPQQMPQQMNPGMNSQMNSQMNSGMGSMNSGNSYGNSYNNSYGYNNQSGHYPNEFMPYYPENRRW